jgi:hypothetical protein
MAVVVAAVGLSAVVVAAVAPCIPKRHRAGHGTVAHMPTGQCGRHCQVRAATTASLLPPTAECRLTQMRMAAAADAALSRFCRLGLWRRRALLLPLHRTARLHWQVQPLPTSLMLPLLLLLLLLLPRQWLQPRRRLSRQPASPPPHPVL